MLLQSINGETRSLLGYKLDEIFASFFTLNSKRTCQNVAIAVIIELVTVEIKCWFAKVFCWAKGKKNISNSHVLV